jgi:hypothetical protein
MFSRSAASSFSITGRSALTAPSRRLAIAIMLCAPSLWLSTVSSRSKNTRPSNIGRWLTERPAISRSRSRRSN